MAASDADIATLMDMGFERDQSHAALVRSANVEGALELLFAHTDNPSGMLNLPLYSAPPPYSGIGPSNAPPSLAVVPYTGGDEMISDPSSWDTAKPPPPARPSTPINRGRQRDSAAPAPEGRTGGRDNPIDIDEDDVAKAIRISLEQSTGGEDADLRKATEASLATAASANGAADWTTLPPTERMRADLTRPMILRSSSPLGAALPPILQGLFALEPFRAVVLALTFEPTPRGQDEAFDMDGYWRGQAVWKVPASDAEQNVAIVMALQRLFWYMLRSRRAVVQIADVEAVLDAKMHVNFHQSPLERSKAYLNRIVEALSHCIQQELDRRLQDGGEVDTLQIRHEYDQLKRLVFSTTAPTSDIHNEQETSVLPLTLPLFQTPTLHSALDFTAAGTTVITSVADAGMFLIERTGGPFGMLNGKFEISPTLYLDRYTNLEHVRPAQQRSAELKTERDALTQRWNQLAPPEMPQTLVDVLEYLNEHADDEHGDAERVADLTRMREGVVKAQAALERQRTNITARQTVVADEMAKVFDDPALAQIGPFNLSSALIWGGVGGREGVAAYVRHGETWSIACTNDGMPTLKEATLEMLLGEDAGVHLSAGVFAVFYAREPSTIPLPVSEPPVAIAEAIDADNRLFAVELPDEVTAMWDLPPAPPTIERVDSAAMLVDDEPEEAELIVSPHFVDPARLRGGMASEDEDYDDEDDESDDDDGALEPEVDLGIVRPMPKKRPHVAAMNGKVGGLPVWLDPSHPIEREQVVCGVCRGGQDEETMRFLLQINAPAPDQPDAYRALYVFACHRGACLLTDSTKSVRVVRSQLPEENALYRYDADADKVETIDQAFVDAEEAKHCPLCGLAGSIACECSASRYCSSRCRKLVSAALAPTCCVAAPSLSDSARQSARTKLRTAQSKLSWTEASLDVEPEPDREPAGEALTLKGLTVTPASSDSAADQADARAPETKSAVDKAFLRFHERVQREPRQILRYYRHAEEPDEPLWVSDAGKPDTISACSSCGAQRTCELQILSTLIAALGVDDTAKDSLDFGTLLVYTCTASCDPPPAGYAIELAVHQPFAADGVDLGSGPVR